MHSNSFIGFSSVVGPTLGVLVTVAGVAGFVVSSTVIAAVGFGVFGLSGLLIRKVSTIECGEEEGSIVG